MSPVATSLETVYQTFVEQGDSTVYLVRCCGRVYLGRNPAARCRTCDQPPANQKVESAQGLTDLLAKLPDVVEARPRPAEIPR